MLINVYLNKHSNNGDISPVIFPPGCNSKALRQQCKEGPRDGAEIGCLRPRSEPSWLDFSPLLDRYQHLVFLPTEKNPFLK